MAARLWQGALLFLCGAISVGIFTLGPRAAPTIHLPVTVATDSLDFGTAWEQSDFTHELKVTNSTNKPVSISGFTLSCNCSSISPASLTLAPGEIRGLRVKIDLRSKQLPASEATSRTFKVSVVPRISGYSYEAQPWTISGTVKTPLLVEPRVLHFEDAIVKGGSPVTRTLSIRPQTEMLGVSATCDPAKAEVEVREPSEGVYEIAVTPSKVLAAGTFDFAILLQPITSQGDELPPVHIRTTGVVVNDIFALPGSFGVNNDAEQVTLPAITLQSRSAKEFSVEEVVTKGDVRNVEPSTSPMNQLHHFTIGVSPKKDRTSSGNGKAVFIVNDGVIRYSIEVRVGSPESNLSGK